MRKLRVCTLDELNRAFGCYDGEVAAEEGGWLAALEEWKVPGMILGGVVLAALVGLTIYLYTWVGWVEGEEGEGEKREGKFESRSGLSPRPQIHRNGQGTSSGQLGVEGGRGN